MKSIIRKVDDAGRVMIPKSLRDKFDLSEGDELEIFEDGGRIVVRKHAPRCVFCGGDSGLVEYKEKFICKACVETLNS